MLRILLCPQPGRGAVPLGIVDNGLFQRWGWPGQENNMKELPVSSPA